MKHINLTLAGVCILALSAVGQIKTQTTQQNATNSTTLVIKDSKEVNDLELLNDSFDLDDYDVNDVIIIATDANNSTAAIPETINKPVRTEKVKYTAPKVKKVRKRIGKGTSSTKFSKRNKRPKRKSDMAYMKAPKRSKKAKWNKRCYSW